MSLQLGSWRVTLGRADHCPQGTWPIVEEDTYRVLSAPAVVPEAPDHPVRVMTAVLHAEPTPTGTIIEEPQRWLAIVHDVAQTPTTEPELVRRLLRTLLDRLQNQGRIPCLEPWGVRFGPWSLQASLKILASVLQERWRPGLSRIHLRMEPAHLEAAQGHLAALTR